MTRLRLHACHSADGLRSSCRAVVGDVIPHHAGGDRVFPYGEHVRHSGAAAAICSASKRWRGPAGPRVRLLSAVRRQRACAPSVSTWQVGQAAEPGDQVDAHGYLVLAFVAGTRSLTRDGVAGPLLEKGLDGHGARAVMPSLRSEGKRCMQTRRGVSGACRHRRLAAARAPLDDDRRRRLRPVPAQTLMPRRISRSHCPAMMEHAD